MFVQTTLHCANEGQDFVGAGFSFRLLGNCTKALVTIEVLVTNNGTNSCTWYCSPGECNFSVKSGASLS